MAEPFISEIRIFAANYAPRYWAFCNGQLLPISQNTALFALIGTAYGGDGKSTFALPDLQGRAPMQAGRGPGLSDRTRGETGGSETVTLTTGEMPAHNHAPRLSGRPGVENDPNGRYWGVAPLNAYRSAPQNLTAMAATALSSTGGSQPHHNMQPYLALNFCIALEGVFPPRG